MLKSKRVLITFLTLAFLISGMASSLNAADNWVKTNTPDSTRFYAIGIAPNGDIYSCGYDFLYKSVDNGNTWTEIEIEIEHHGLFRSFSFGKDGRIYLAGVENVYRSEDDGESWELLLHLQNRVFSSVMECPDGSILTGGAWLHRSTDDGNSWDIVATLGDNNMDFSSFCISRTTKTVFVTAKHFMGEGGIRRSTDGGATWSESVLSEISFTKIISDSEGRLFAATDRAPDSNNGVYWSLDDGLTWEKGDGWFQCKAMAVNDKDEVYVGLFGDLSGGVGISYNHCESWNRLEGGIDKHTDVWDMDINKQGYLFLAAADGVYRSVDPVNSIEEEQSTIKNAELMQNYPNPFNPETTIEYDLQNTGNINIVVYNAGGEQVWAAGNRRQAAGNHTLLFDGSGLNSGIYFYALQVGGEVMETKKMVLVK